MREGTSKNLNQTANFLSRRKIRDFLEEDQGESKSRIFGWRRSSTPPPRASKGSNPYEEPNLTKSQKSSLPGRREWPAARGLRKGEGEPQSDPPTTRKLSSGRPGTQPGEPPQPPPRIPKRRIIQKDPEDQRRKGRKESSPCSLFWDRQGLPYSNPWPKRREEGATPTKRFEEKVWERKLSCS